MSNEAVRQIIEEKLETDWAAATPIDWDNSDYVPKKGDTFIRPKIEGTSSQILTKTCQREFYQIQIDVFIPKGTGTGEAMTLADVLVAMFYNFRSGYLSCKEGFVQRIGDVEEWHKRRVFIEAKYDNHF